MPCVAKKYECDVPELSTVVGATHGVGTDGATHGAGTVGETQGASTDDATRGAGASDAGLVPDAPVASELAAEVAPDVDAVLTVREFGRLLRLVGVELHGAFRGALRQPAGAFHRRGHHFRTHRRRDGGGPTLGGLPHHRRESRFQRLRYHGRHAGDALDVPRACHWATPRCASLWPAAWRIRRSCWTRWNPGRPPSTSSKSWPVPGGCVGGGGQPIHVQLASWPRRSRRRAEPPRRRATPCATPTRTPTSRSCTPTGSASRCRIRPTSGCTPIRKAGRSSAVAERSRGPEPLRSRSAPLFVGSRDSTERRGS